MDPLDLRLNFRSLDRFVPSHPASFVKSWKDLMECVASKSAALKAA